VLIINEFAINSPNFFFNDFHFLVGFPIQKSWDYTCFPTTLGFPDCKRSEQRRKNRLLTPSNTS
jgi:hypothetical protein